MESAGIRMHWSLQGEVQRKRLLSANIFFIKKKKYMLALLLKKCANLLFRKIFAENCMKMKEFGLRGGVRPPLSPPLHTAR